MRSYKNSDPRPPIMEGAPPPPDMRLPFIDWDRPPWNRWAFQRMREIVPTAPIARGSDVSALPEAHEDILGIAFEFDGQSRTVAEMIEDTYTDGLLIWIGGKVVHESYYNRMEPKTLHLAQSVSKSITATAGACLIDEGLLDVNAPLTEYLPELSRTAWNGATVQHVLDMASGVRYSEAYDQRESDVGRTDYASGWKPAPDGLDVSDWPNCVFDQILTLKDQEAEHGSRFHYRSIETDVLAHVYERVSGMRVPELISKRLWAPMGAEFDANITVDPAGYGLACGGISASLRDFARFGLAMLNDGQVEGRQVIPKAWIADVRGGDHGHFNDEGRAYFPSGHYRNKFWIEEAGKPAHYCLGVFGQSIYVNPETGMVVVKLSSWPDFQDPAMLKDSIAASHAIARAFGAV